MITYGIPLPEPVTHGVMRTARRPDLRRYADLTDEQKTKAHAYLWGCLMASSDPDDDAELSAAMREAIGYAEDAR